jgi:hypothetical protein
VDKTAQKPQKVIPIQRFFRIGITCLTRGDKRRSKRQPIDDIINNSIYGGYGQGRLGCFVCEKYVFAGDEAV